MKYLFLFLFLLVLIILLVNPIEKFTLNLPSHLRFMKENKFDDGLSQKDINLLRRIQGCYKNPNLYYECINRLGLPYLKNPKPSRRFRKEINYKKHRDISHLLPYKHHFGHHFLN